MIKIYFVRHAKPNLDNHDDRTRELSPQGLQERHRVTDYFSTIHISRIFSSPYKRALDTILPLAEAKGMNPILIEDFRERKIDGWVDDFDAYARKQWEDFDFKELAGESLRQVQQRNIAALREILDRHPGEDVIIAGHGTAISTVLNYYVPTFGYEHFQRIKGIMPFVAALEFEDSGEFLKCNIEELG